MSSQTTVGVESNATSKATNSDTSTTSNPVALNRPPTGAPDPERCYIPLNQHLITFWRHCICLALLGIMLLAATGQVHAAQTAANDPDVSTQNQVLITMLNQERANFGFKSVQPDTNLDALADLYLQSIIGRRSFMIEPLTFIGYPVLYQDIANAVGAEGYILRSHGLTLSFGIGTKATFQSALDDDRNRPALIDNTMDLAGFASGIVPDGPDWIENPPGGGVPIEITGYTIIVTITAGDF